MGVCVVEVWCVGVSVGTGRVCVFVRMPSRDWGMMEMGVMCVIMAMGMVVGEHFVGVLMRVAFIDNKPNTHDHEEEGEVKGPCGPFMKNDDGEENACKGRHGIVGARACCA